MNQVVRAAGFLIFRKTHSKIEFLLLKEGSKKKKKTKFSNFELNSHSDPNRRIMENGTGQLRRATLKWFQNTNERGYRTFYSYFSQY